jgi:hypothetical protein
LSRVHDGRGREDLARKIEWNTPLGLSSCQGRGLIFLHPIAKT